MTTRRTRPPDRDTPNLETVMLARLGLPPTASSQEVEAAHDALIEFIDLAPDDLRDWADQQIGLIDEAFALLSDPTADRSALADELMVASARGSARGIATVVAAHPGPGDRREATAGNRMIRRLAILAAGVVGMVAIAIAGFNLNGGTGVPPINGTPAPEAAASPAVDQAQVAGLMERIAANPQDITSLKSLADLYYQANDFTTARSFLEKILAIDSKNVTALLALGAVQFNTDDVTNAERQWRAVLAIDPNNLDAHYYLGFMYLYRDPPDLANVKLEWDKVIAIDPNSELATTVAAHLASLEASPSPGTPGATTSPRPSGSPGAGPATSPAASGG